MNISRRTGLLWVQTFWSGLAEALLAHRWRPGTTWFVDEEFTFPGKGRAKRRLDQAFDRHGQVVVVVRDHAHRQDLATHYRPAGATLHALGARLARGLGHLPPQPEPLGRCPGPGGAAGAAAAQQHALTRTRGKYLGPRRGYRSTRRRSGPAAASRRARPTTTNVGAVGAHAPAPTAEPRTTAATRGANPGDTSASPASRASFGAGWPTGWPTRSRPAVARWSADGLLNLVRGCLGTDSNRRPTA